MAGTPTPTQAEANAIMTALYNGDPPPTLAHDGSPPDTGAIPGQAATLSQQQVAGAVGHAPAHTPAHHTTTTHRETARSKA